MIKLKSFIATMFVAGLFSGHAMAQDGAGYALNDTTARSTFYFGAGTSNDDGPDAADETPLVIGFTHQPMNSKMVWGLDIAREGTMLDSTYGQDRAVSSAISFNLLVGRNFVETAKYKVDGALILGVREEAQDCPASFLGYQCYADTDPETEYTGNFGALATISLEKMVIGVRATSESAQVLVGFRF